MTLFLERSFLWSGGALFVLALAWCVYSLVALWGEPRPFDARAAIGSASLNLALFVLFAAHHSLLAREWAKALVARVLPTRLIRSVYVWIASLLFLLVVTAWQTIGGVLYQAPGWLALPHVLLQLTGVWLIARAVTAIDGLELAGIRSASTHTPLQARGAYALVRHPIYLGTLLGVFGFARMTGDRFLFAILVTTYLVIAVMWEERSLELAFGSEYREYKQRVPWRIVPFVY
jgi:hypothetical protein